MPERKEEQRKQTLEEIEAVVRNKFPNLPESEVVGSEAWKRKVQAEAARRLVENIKGIAQTEPNQ